MFHPIVPRIVILSVGEGLAAEPAITLPGGVSSGNPAASANSLQLFFEVVFLVSCYTVFAFLGARPRGVYPSTVLREEIHAIEVVVPT